MGDKSLTFDVPEEAKFASWLRIIFTCNGVPEEAAQEAIDRFLNFKAAFRKRIETELGHG